MRCNASRVRAILAAGVLLLSAGGLHADTLAFQREQVQALGKLTTAPAMQDAKGFAREGRVKAVYFDALPWKGKPTKVFAWLGMPADSKGKVPGVVLVHGGGGTAFKEWVQKWNERGFAAISIAVEGQTDRKAPAKSGKRGGWKQHAWPGPKRAGIYGDSAAPLTEQWMYHAVADTVLANSLLRSLPEVDAEKVGVAGISWGGVITSTVMGIDGRFAFAIPTYGCGHKFDSKNQYGRSLGKNRLYREVWDPMVRIKKATMPTLWLSWPGDQHFPLDCQAACYRAMPGAYMVALLPGMKHSHAAGWNPPDSYAFAESIVRDGRPWCRQTAATRKDGAVRVSFASAKPLDRATLISTSDTGVTGSRKWAESPAQLEKRGDEWVVTSPLPPGATAWIVNVRSSKLTASSDFQETK
jgi:dienelactone hydrolase